MPSQRKKEEQRDQVACPRPYNKNMAELELEQKTWSQPILDEHLLTIALCFGFVHRRFRTTCPELRKESSWEPSAMTF